MAESTIERILSQECDVCKAPAPEHFHFGGRCCYSCRAFFRRTVQRVQRKGLKKCKAGTRDCEVSQSAKSCIHCRYNKCISIGMKPERLKGKRKKPEAVREEEADREESESGEECGEKSEAASQPQQQPHTSSTATQQSRVSVIRPVSEVATQRSLHPQVTLSPQADIRADSPTEAPAQPTEIKPLDVLYYSEKLLQTDGLYKSSQKFSGGGDLTDLQVDELLRVTLEEMENKQELRDDWKIDLENYQEVRRSELDGGTMLGYCSVITGPEMSLTTEEINHLDFLVLQQVTACKHCMPVSLFQARVGGFLGTLKMDEMLAVFSISRKAQNFWHYSTMCSMPGFQELSSRTQSQLIIQNMQMCYSLTMSYYFFGHDASTAVGQEEQTGILTGLGDFIRANAPYALSMPPAFYEDYYRSPWATTTQLEDSHKSISKDIGNSLKDVGILGYIVIYCLTLYNVSEEDFEKWNTPDRDIKAIQNVRHFLETIYVRLLKHKFGWKKATHKMFNQKFIMDQMNQVMLINTMENLQLNDFSNSQTVNPLTEK